MPISRFTTPTSSRQRLHDIADAQRLSFPTAWSCTSRGRRDICLWGTRPRPWRDGGRAAPL